MFSLNTLAEFEEEDDERSLLADTIEPPTFSPLGRTGPPEPLHQNKKLRWDHKVWEMTA